MNDRSLPPLGATRLIGDSFRFLFANFGLLFPLALVPALLAQAASIALLPDASLDPEAPISLGPGFAIVSIGGSLVWYLTLAVMSLLIVDLAAGGRRSLDSYLREVLPHTFTLLVLGLLISFAAALGFLLFIIPGLYIAAQFFVWVQCVTVENEGMAGLGRAQTLTKGYRWPIAGAMLLIGVMAVGVLLVLTPAIAANAESAGGLILSLLSALLEALLYAVFGVYTTLVYLRLREIKDGVGPADIAAGAT